MPSEKPDFAEIKSLLKKRNLYFTEHKNYFYKLSQKCLTCIENGFTNRERAIELLRFLESETVLKTIFPNNLLYEVLISLVSNCIWNNYCEAILLQIISSFYDGTTRPTIDVQFDLKETTSLNLTNSPKFMKPPEFDQRDIKELYNKFTFSNDLSFYLFDIIPPMITLKDRFFSFTGNFKNFTRKTCFEKVRILGGVPSDPDPYVDYFFVANEQCKNNIISTKLLKALHNRFLYCHLKIFTESDWEKIVSDQINK